MAKRSTECTLRFSHPFRLTALDRAQPAGNYRLVTEEERIEGLSFEAFQRMHTLLYLPANSGPGRAREVIDVDPAEIATAVVADALKSFGAALPAP
ncbi:MAG TPA: hypothetical protein VLA02_13775 [Reyranella sp.]|nr:hypothetical protein [Reyranella sp.]